MKLELNNIRFKNFLSFGNKWTEFDLLNGLNLITGKIKETDKSNGSGKSSFLEVFPYALFGNTLKNLNNEDIINSKNKKNCEVELKFKINNDNFMIHRGLYPNILEIEKNGRTINEDFSDKRDLQKWIEEEIYGFSFLVCKNLIHLNLNKSKSILDMTKGEKRNFIENFFNLYLFKAIHDKANEKSRNINLKIIEFNSRIESNKRLINQYNEQISIFKNKLNNISSSNNILENIINEINNKENELNLLKNKEKSLMNLNEINDKIENLKDENKKIENEIERIREINGDFEIEKAKLNALIDDTKKRLNQMNGNSKCPLCWSKIDLNEISNAMDEDNLERLKRIEKINPLIFENSKFINEQKDIILKNKENISSLRIEEKNIIDFNSQISNEKNKLNELNLKKQQIEEKIELEEKTKNELITNIDEYFNKINELQLENNLQNKSKDNLKSVSDYLDYMKSICKDENVKQFAISNIVPYINKQTNYYLNETDQSFFVILDKWLEIVIKGPGIDGGKYGNLSGGETKILDLSLQQAFLDVAKIQMKNFPDILIYDELLDSSVDSLNLESLFNIVKIKQKDDKNKTFIISHRNEISEFDFDKIYYLIKENGFTNLIK